MKERDLMRLCTDWLAAEGYFVLRLNSGFFKFDSPNGKSRVFRGHKPGTADLLVIGEGKSACHLDDVHSCEDGVAVYFFELKAARGIQSSVQKAFEKDVAARGMTYVLVRSLEDLQNALRPQGRFSAKD